MGGRKIFLLVSSAVVRLAGACHLVGRPCSRADLWRGGPLDLALRWRNLERVGCVGCRLYFFVLWLLELLEEGRCRRRLRRDLLSRLLRLWWVEDESLWE